MLGFLLLSHCSLILCVVSVFFYVCFILDDPFFFLSFFKNTYLFIYLAALGLGCSTWALPCGAQALECAGSVVVVRGVL